MARLTEEQLSGMSTDDLFRYGQQYGGADQWLPGATLGDPSFQMGSRLNQWSPNVRRYLYGPGLFTSTGAGEGEGAGPGSAAYFSPEFVQYMDKKHGPDWDVGFESVLNRPERSGQRAGFAMDTATADFLKSKGYSDDPQVQRYLGGKGAETQYLFDKGERTRGGYLSPLEDAASVVGPFALSALGGYLGAGGAGAGGADAAGAGAAGAAGGDAGYGFSYGTAGAGAGPGGAGFSLGPSSGAAFDAGVGLPGITGAAGEAGSYAPGFSLGGATGIGFNPGVSTAFDTALGLPNITGGEQSFPSFGGGGGVSSPVAPDAAVPASPGGPGGVGGAPTSGDSAVPLLGEEENVAGAIPSSGEPSLVSRALKSLGIYDPVKGDLGKNAFPAAGLAANIGGGYLQRKSQGKAAEELKRLGQPAQNASNDLLARFKSGELPTAQAQGIKTWQEQAVADIKGFYSRAGLSGSSMEVDQINKVKAQAEAMADQARQGLLTQGLQAAQVGQGPLASAISSQAQQDAELRSAQQNMLATLAMFQRTNR